ncbi:NADAR family protein [Enterobacteriaceae bacterium 4M9]|nr:NADAR family protein [Enterobacteriaceae bacterium 4M9]
MNQGSDALQALLAAIDAGEQFSYLWFWSHRPHPRGEMTSSCLSLWWDCSFTADGHTWRSAEHWMMAAKAKLFGDETKYAQILDALTPVEAKNLGREIASVDEALWESRSFELLCEGNYHKFSQNPALKAYLLSTGKQVLVEASPVDSLWGIGLAQEHKDAAVPSRWQGQNQLGFALMHVRDRLAQA